MHPIASYARTAYAQGWAASGGPLTEKVQAGCVAAIHYAIEHADDPDVLEATLHLGHLEGVWAAIFQRRTDLYATTTGAVVDAWHALVSSVDLSSVVQAVRHQAGLREAKRDETVAQYATTLILALLQSLMFKKEWLALKQAVEDAIRAGTAEGEASAMALLADATGGTNFNFDQAFQDAYQDLGQSSPMAASVDTWLGQLMNLIAWQTGNQLADDAADGDDEEDMTDGATDILTNPGKSTSHFMDYLVHIAITAGILWWYKRHGVQNVWWITAGDERVCPQCDQLEADSPFAINDMPTMPPAHPLCRCTLYTEDDLSAALVDAYL